MAFRLWLAPVFALSLVASAVVAQPPKPRNPVEERLKAGRLEVPDGVDSGKFNQMRLGTISLENPTDAERAVLEGKAKQLVYPVTHFEYHTNNEAPTAELTPRPEERTVNRLIADLENQLVIITPGDQGIPAPKVDFAREFGKAAVKAIDDVLAKGPQPIVRMNAVRMLAAVAKSGAPAATERLAKLLAEKDKTLPVESLYFALKGAENAIAAFDPARAAANQKWVSKDTYHQLVTLVDEVVRKVPQSVIDKTYLPDQPNTGTLTTDPKAAPKPAALTPEQVDTVQAFRLQAIRALGKVKTDVVTDAKGGGTVRTLLTLARVAANDAGVVPAPSQREVAESLIGMANATPVDRELDLDAQVLAVAMARGVSLFVSDKAAGGAGEGGPASSHWKLYGTKLKSAFEAWDRAIPKSRLDQGSKSLLTEFSKLAVTQVFDPLSKMNESGVANGLKKEAVDEWLAKKQGELKANALYKNSDATKLTPR